MAREIDFGGFTKLYGKMLCQSSLLECDPVTRWVFVYMLSQADEDGFFRCATLQSLALAARVTRDQAAKAVAELESPDPASTSQNRNGRRILSRPGGWKLVTYKKYREHRSRRQIIDAIRQKRQRDRDASRTSRDVTVTSRPDLDLDLDLDLEKKEEKNPPSPSRTDGIIFIKASNSKDSDFDGPGIEKILHRLREYEAEFGKPWCNAQWRAAVEWAFDNPEKSKKLWGRFLLNWFRTAARDERKRMRA